MRPRSRVRTQAAGGLGLCFALALAACSGGEKVSSNGDKVIAGGEGSVSAGKATGGKPGADPARPAVGSKEAKCAALRAEVTSAADALATCEVNGDCRVVSAEVCQFEGLGCNFVFKHKSLAQDPLDAALAAYAKAQCPVARCDCRAPPQESACIEGRCTFSPAITRKSSTKSPPPRKPAARCI